MLISAPRKCTSWLGCFVTVGLGFIYVVMLFQSSQSSEEFEHSHEDQKILKRVNRMAKSDSESFFGKVFSGTNGETILTAENTNTNNDLVSSSHGPIVCADFIQRTHFEQRGDFYVLANYFKATKYFHCDESITYTTHGEYTYLDNLIPLLERWQGPLSMTLYTPGYDYNEAVKRIVYMRECLKTTLVKDLVTFHLFFDINHLPLDVIELNPESLKPDCSKDLMTVSKKKITYKKANMMPYPVNVARMVARDMAATHYVLPSDVELYPSPHLIPAFLEMIKRDDKVLHSPNPKIFVIPIFEADKRIQRLPDNKYELLDELNAKRVISFHKYVCTHCHNLPNFTQWLEYPIEDGMSTFMVAKRQGAHKYWEPIFIGTKNDPGYDTRLSWEGTRDKMTQGYALCLLDYEFHILDNAFLIHRPGIKLPKKRSKFEDVYWHKQNDLIFNVIAPEIIRLYGPRQGCACNKRAA